MAKSDIVEANAQRKAATTSQPTVMQHSQSKEAARLGRLARLDGQDSIVVDSGKEPIKTTGVCWKNATFVHDVSSVTCKLKLKKQMDCEQNL